MNNPKISKSELSRLEAKANTAIAGLTRMQGRILNVLVSANKAPTGFIASKCQCGNVSAAVTAMQSHLVTHGLFIRNYYPESGSLNKFGEASRTHIWELIGSQEEE